MAKSTSKKTVRKIKPSTIVDASNVGAVLKQMKDNYNAANDGKYDLTVSIGDLVVQTKTDSVVDAILGIKPEKVMQKTLFRVEALGKAAEFLVYPVRAKRIFYNHLAAEYFVKRLLVSMK